MKEQLLGAWELVSFEQHAQGGQVHYPMGENPRGLLVYLPNGIMTVQLMRQDRKAFESQDIWNGKTQEVVDAFVSYTAYFGRYELREDENLVIHHVDGSLFPNWSGGVQTRTVAFAGERLILKSPPVVAGEKLGYIALVWKRCV